MTAVTDSIDRICIVCGRTFIPRHGNASMCSGECRDTRKGLWTPDGVPRVCLTCGEEFVPRHHLSRTCSPECASIRGKENRKIEQRRRREEQRGTLLCIDCGAGFQRRPRSNSKRCDPCRTGETKRLQREARRAERAAQLPPPTREIRPRAEKQAEPVETSRDRWCIVCGDAFTLTPHSRAERCPDCQKQHRKSKRAGYDREYHNRKKGVDRPVRMPRPNPPAPAPIHAAAPATGTRKPPRYFKDGSVGYWSIERALKREEKLLAAEGKPRYKTQAQETA